MTQDNAENEARKLLAAELLTFGYSRGGARGIIIRGETIPAKAAVRAIIKALQPSPLAGDADDRAHLLAEVERLRSVIGTMSDTIDMADRLIERGYGIDISQEWHKQIAEVAKARAALESKTHG